MSLIDNILTMKNFKTFWILLPIVSFLALGCGDKEEQSTKVPEEQPELVKGVPVRVGPADLNSTFSYYNTSPESPDGTMISYVKILTEQNERYDSMDGELWVCDADLTNHRMLTELNNFITHNGVNAQWIDNNTIVYYTNDEIRAVNLEGQQVTGPIEAFSIGHKPHNNKILYSAVSDETNYHTIYEYDIFTNEKREIADASTFSGISNFFPIINPYELSERKIRHLIYSPDGSKIALRYDVNDEGESGNHLVTMDMNGGDIKFFGPKPMHFSWYDNSSLMGHDNQINDGNANDKSARRWSREKEYIETLAGPGNHLSSSDDRLLIATESWYNSDPVILRVFNKGEITPFWEDSVSVDDFTVWGLGNHVNPSFSRDGKRVYYHKSVAPGKSQAYMVLLP